MNYSEFKQKLGSDPASQDPEFLRARHSSPEFIQAALESDRFERALKRAAGTPAPADLLPRLKRISQVMPSRQGAWKYYAMAASLFLAIAAVGLGWRMSTTRFDSVEQYVAAHYHHDGPALLLQAEGRVAGDADAVLDRFHARMTPELSRMVGSVRICRTPDGKGVHMVLHTDRGLVTVIFMPDTVVTDGQLFGFDGMQAQLVALVTGSAAIIGTSEQHIADFYTLVHDSIIAPGTSA